MSDIQLTNPLPDETSTSYSACVSPEEQDQQTTHAAHNLGNNDTTTTAPPSGAADVSVATAGSYTQSHSHSCSHSHPHAHLGVKDGGEGDGEGEGEGAWPGGHGHGHDHVYGVCGAAGGVVVESGDEDDDDDDEVNEDNGQESGGIEAGVKDDGEHSISDPLSDPAELKALTSTLSSYYLYRRTAHLNITHQRRKEYWALSRKHREVLDQAMNGTGEGAYLEVLSSLDAAIAENAEVAEGIFASGVGAFGVSAEISGEEHQTDVSGGDSDTINAQRGSEKTGKGKKSWWESHATPEDMEKVKSTLKQFYRDWALEGHTERERCYKPVLDELCSQFPLNEAIDPSTTSGGEGAAESKRRRDEIKVLVPGAGLGRLAFDIVCAGFESQGNEFSYHQLVASNFVLNWYIPPYTNSPFLSHEGS